jgi:hypothetical protein
MNHDHLIKMANQIAANLAARGEAKALRKPPNISPNSGTRA